MVCEELGVSDLENVKAHLESHREAVEGFPKVESLLLQIADIVSPTLAKHGKSNKHKFWCSKHWKSAISKLESWSEQSKQLPVGLSLVLCACLCFVSQIL